MEASLGYLDDMLSAAGGCEQAVTTCVKRLITKAQVSSNMLFVLIGSVSMKPSNEHHSKCSRGEVKKTSFEKQRHLKTMSFEKQRHLKNVILVGKSIVSTTTNTIEKSISHLPMNTIGHRSRKRNFISVNL